MPKTRATFIEPMLLLGTEKLPQGADWSYEIKFRFPGSKVLGTQVFTWEYFGISEVYSYVSMFMPECANSRPRYAVASFLQETALSHT